MSRFSCNVAIKLCIILGAMEGRTRLFQRNKSVRIPIKKVPKGTSLNGAGNMVVLETISHLLKVIKTEEYHWIEFNLQKLIA